jgi:hypothetical protein
VALMGQARGIDTVYTHQKWIWAIALGYTMSITVHILGSSPSRMGDFGLISYRVEHAGEDFEAQVLLVA